MIALAGNPVESQASIEVLREEIQALEAEIRMLRRRDETVAFQMRRMDEEMRVASRLQRDFLPQTFPELGSIRFSALYRPATYVSGDIYDVMRLDENHVGFYIADAVGHGMPAALLTMFIKRALVTKKILKNGYRLLSPGETLHALNQSLLDQHLSQSTFATALYGVVDTTTGQVKFGRAGHPCPIILRTDNTYDSPDADGGLLGIFPDETYSDGIFTLNAGDRAILFSDGVEVAFSPSEVIDPDQWQIQLLKRRHLPTPALLTDLTAYLDHECPSLDAKDDLTLLVVEHL